MDRTLEEALSLVSRYTGLAEILSDGPHDLFGEEETCSSFDLRYTVHAPVADIIAAVVVVALIWLKHRENIVRLWRREEKSWRKVK